MRLASIAREAALNVRSGTTRAATFATALVFGISLLAGADIAAVAEIQREARQFQAAGGSTLIYRMNAGISGEACEALASVDGVRAAGAVRQEPAAAHAGALPGHEIPTFSVSPNFQGFQAIGNPTAHGGVIVSGDLAAALGLREGDVAEFVEGSPRIDSVYTYDDDGRRPGLGYAVLVPSPTTAPFDECWAETWPMSNGLTSLLSSTLVPGAVTLGSGGPTPQLLQLNSTLGATFDGTKRFAGRITRFAPEAAAALALVLGFVAVRLRRLEFASALHARTKRSAQTLQILLETVGWTIAASMIGALIVLVLIRTQYPGDMGDLISVGIPTFASLPATLVGALVGSALVRERNLFAYFRER
ncbi:hypothetical protein ACPPVQ_01120 [Diaminobutyricibacter sp. McL0618]|uniref:hypothetical protein n=1 Tax=Leifsonia sp. McL0618 TaxID=3415677 RepID=UPI003CE907F5